MATKNVMTEREIMTQILDGTVDTDILIAYAEKRIAALDKRTASAQKRAAAKRAESDELLEQVYELMSAEPMNRAQVTAMVNEKYGTEYSESKIGAKLVALTKDERLVKEKIRYKGEDGKSKESTVYSIA